MYAQQYPIAVVLLLLDDGLIEPAPLRPALSARAFAFPAERFGNHVKDDL
jgi:hypothetical protein